MPPPRAPAPYGRTTSSSPYVVHPARPCSLVKYSAASASLYRLSPGFSRSVKATPTLSETGGSPESGSGSASYSFMATTLLSMV